MVSCEILYISWIIAVELWKVAIFWKQSFFGVHDTTILLNWQPPWRSLDGYKHVIDVEYCPPASCEGPHYPLEAAKAKAAAQNAPSTQSTLEYHESMEGNSTKRDVSASFKWISMLLYIFYSKLKSHYSFRTEEMICGLQQLGWKKVDVSFHSAFWPFFAHNFIHVSSILFLYVPPHQG